MARVYYDVSLNVVQSGFIKIIPAKSVLLADTKTNLAFLVRP